MYLTSFCNFNWIVPLIEQIQTVFWRLSEDIEGNRKQLTAEEDGRIYWGTKTADGFSTQNKCWNALNKTGNPWNVQFYILQIFRITQSRINL